MRPLAFVVLGAVAYGIFLAATMPASFVAARAQAASRDALRIQDAGGTLWNGRARATLSTPAGAVSVDEVRWRFAPEALAGGRFAFHVDAQAAALTARGEVGRSAASWEVRDGHLEGPAAGLAALVPLLAAWRPEGELRGEVPSLAWNDRELRGEAAFEWRGAAVALSTVRPLGHYRARLQGAGAPARFTVTTVEGPLRIAGEGTLDPSGGASFAGEARAEGPAAASLQGLLDLLGPRRADGSREIRWQVQP